MYRFVYVRVFDDPTPVITRETQMREWNRDWKIRLIEERDPDRSGLTGVLR
jgi:putative endonuclease